MKNEKHYTIEVNKEGEELSICYFAASTLNEAKNILSVLKQGCTAYDITVTITDDKAQVIESWQLGNEYKKPTKLQQSYNG